METERLILRRFMPTDWLDLYEYLSQEEVVKYEPYDIFTQEEAKEEAIKRSNNLAFYAVCLLESGKLIGNIYFEKQGFDTWELGYVFNQKFQGEGYATEAARALIDDAFANQGAHRIFAMCNPENTASWKLLERLNMRREAHQIKNIWFFKDLEGNPIWQDTYEYAILKEEWNQE